MSVLARRYLFRSRWQIAAIVVLLVSLLIWFVFAAPGTSAPVSSGEQSDSLADGIVTHEEYVGAIGEVRDCVASAGFPVGPLRDIAGRVDFLYGGAESEASLREQQRVYTECFEHYAREIVAIWALQNPVPRDEVERKVQGMAECLRDLGLPVPENAGAPEVAAFASSHGREFSTCASQFVDERGILEF